MNDSPVYKLWVGGRPRPKARPRKGKHGNFYTPKQTKEWEALVAWKWREQHGADVPFKNGPVSLKAVFYYADRRAPDTDNLVKLICDSLNGIAWNDDRQVVEIYARKILGAEVEGVDLEIRPCDS